MKRFHVPLRAWAAPPRERFRPLRPGSRCRQGRVKLIQRRAQCGLRRAHDAGTPPVIRPSSQMACPEHTARPEELGSGLTKKTVLNFFWREKGSARMWLLAAALLVFAAALNGLRGGFEEWLASTGMFTPWAVPILARGVPLIEGVTCALLVWPGWRLRSQPCT